MIAFDSVGTLGNKNEYSIKKVQTVSFQLNYVSTLPGKTKNNTKTTNCLLQWLLLNRLFQTIAESRTMFAFFPYLLENFLAVF